MSRSNFTPMKRFHEILNRYGLKLMEVGTNHLSILRKPETVRLLSAPNESFRLPSVAATDLPVDDRRNRKMGNGTGRHYP